MKLFPNTSAAPFNGPRERFAGRIVARSIGLDASWASKAKLESRGNMFAALSCSK